MLINYLSSFSTNFSNSSVCFSEFFAISAIQKNNCAH
nr:MAG TPA: hypothetical protein [Caudoviricetes sp.]